MDTIVVFSPAPGPSGGGGPVQEVINTSTPATSFTSAAVSPASGSNRVCFLLITGAYDGIDGLNNSVASVTWGGVALTAIVQNSITLTSATGSIWGIKEADLPASGTITITPVAASGWRACNAYLVTEANVDQSVDFGSYNTNMEDRADRVIITTATANNRILGMASTPANGNSYDPANVSVSLGTLLFSSVTGSENYNDSWAWGVRIPTTTAGLYRSDATRDDAGQTSRDVNVQIEIPEA